jgi:hypothetical protein
LTILSEPFRVVNKFRQFIQNLCFTLAPAQFSALISAELEKWGTVIRAAGIKVCSATQTIDQAGAVTITCRLTNAAKRTRQASAIQVVLVTTFTPTSGEVMRASRTVTVARTPVRAPNTATTPSIVTG